MSRTLPDSEVIVRDQSVAADIGIVFVDLDGSLIASNSLIESMVRAIPRDPWVLFKAPLWLLRGRRNFKSQMAQHTLPEAEHLPYREDVLVALKELKSDGCRLVLATASHRAVAEEVASYLGLFDDVLATDETRNLKGANKLAAIEEYCRQHGFDEFAYLGDSSADLAVWRHAAKVLVVSPSNRMNQRLAALDVPLETFAPRKRQLHSYLRALRPHQWMKNVLVFLPLLLAHQVNDPAKWAHAVVAFIAFSACASAVYMINDLLDLAADRRHPTKRNRPFAAGQIPLEIGLVAAPVLMLSATVFSLLALDLRFSFMLMAYVVASGLYCVWLKRVAMVDVFLLSGLYMLRIQAGGTASGVYVSEWLLLFSLFFFLSLAFAKRFVELDRHELAADTHVTGRGYRQIDVASLSQMGATSGYIAVLVLALYINGASQAQQLYGRGARILWILCVIVLFWISRLWMLARRNELHDDPVVFALKDRTSQLIGILSALVVVVAWLLH